VSTESARNYIDGNVEGLDASAVHTKIKYFCLISLDAAIFTRELLENYQRWVDAEEVTLNLILLDELEPINSMALLGLGSAEARKSMQLKVEARLREWVDLKTTILSCATFLAEPRCIAWLDRIRCERDGNASFRRHLLTQTFVNLHPRLRRLGVKSKTERIVERCSEYLVSELALKMSLLESEEWGGEVMPRAEMNLVSSMYKGKYPRLRPAVPRRFRIVYHDAFEVRADCELGAAIGHDVGG
jgi:hypothetical protein